MRLWQAGTPPCPAQKTPERERLLLARQPRLVQARRRMDCPRIHGLLVVIRAVATPVQLARGDLRAAHVHPVELIVQTLDSRRDFAAFGGRPKTWRPRIAAFNAVDRARHCPRTTPCLA